MAARTVDQWLTALRGLDGGAPAARETLQGALRARRPRAGLAIAAAAKLAGDLLLHDLAEDLVDAFGWLCDDGAKRDPQARGKLAVANALVALDHWDERVFVAGLRVVQPEGWSPPLDDVAAELRGVCGLAHVQFGRADALDVLADLLADPERVARLAAAHAIGDTLRPDATALLRYALLAGEPEPEVLAALLSSLLALGRASQLAFVLALLPAHDDRAEAAALALGGARIEDAIDPLLAWADACAPEQRRRVGYLALALFRADRANARLLAVIRDGGRDALAAARALATFRDAGVIADDLRAAAAAIADRTLRAEIEQLVAD